jgi:competence protein ComEC
MTALVVPPRPADLRLVPAAAAVWAAVLLGLEAGPGGGGAAVALGVLVLVVALRRRGRAAAALAGAAGCAAAAGLVITAHTLVLDGHPLRSAAERGSAATLHLVVRDDPRPLRATGPGPPQVAVPASLRAAEIAGRRWVGSGRCGGLLRQRSLGIQPSQAASCVRTDDSVDQAWRSRCSPRLAP